MWKNLNARGGSAFTRPTTSASKAATLFCFLDRLDDVVEVWPVAGVEFGMDEFAIGVNLESAAA
jgi:hypothetical protein